MLCLAVCSTQSVCHNRLKPLNSFSVSLSAGVVIHNFASRNRSNGFVIGVGSTVIGNVALQNGIGFNVACPANLTDNSAIDNGTNLQAGEVDGLGACLNNNNLAP
jgi:hypothetical protein